MILHIPTLLGFGSKTGIELSKETSGKVNFRYETEIYNAGFGQGVMTTSIQNVKALTSIANDGILLKPYIVEKIEDSNGKIILENSRTELGRVASKQTTDKIKDLMEDVVTKGTGSNYNMPEYGLIAKTGTAQISSTNGKGYLNGPYDYIRGFAGMFPKDDPQIIIYINTAKSCPETIIPAKKPPSASTPSESPTKMGETIPSKAKMISSFCAAAVEIATVVP